MINWKIRTRGSRAGSPERRRGPRGAAPGTGAMHCAPRAAGATPGSSGALLRDDMCEPIDMLALPGHRVASAERASRSTTTSGAPG